MVTERAIAACAVFTNIINPLYLNLFLQGGDATFSCYFSWKAEKIELYYAILRGEKTPASYRQQSFLPIPTWQQSFLRTGIYASLIREIELLCTAWCVKFTCNFCLFYADIQAQDEASFCDSFAKWVLFCSVEDRQIRQASVLERLTLDSAHIT